MPILNYTTKISTTKTVGEIQAILAKAGAKSVIVGYDNNAYPVEIVFVIDISGNWLNFRLPANWLGVFNRMKKDVNVPRSFKTEEQARRVAWRITKDWVEAQLAIVDAAQAELAEVFLPYAVTKTGNTLFNEFKKSDFLLMSGDKKD